MSYELIEHTGDVGIVARAPTLEALFAEAARAMFELLVEIRRPSPGPPEEFPVDAEAPAEALRDFLGELLYRFSAERKVYVTFAPAPGRVAASADPFDPGRHALRTELKAVTYHQLEVAREDGGWRARVIFDV